MDLAQVLIAMIGLGAALVTFCVMRFPQYRRDPFRQYRAFSFGASLLGAAAILALCMLMILAQGAWQSR
jgi:hypothetical protein